MTDGEPVMKGREDEGYSQGRNRTTHCHVEEEGEIGDEGERLDNTLHDGRDEKDDLLKDVAHEERDEAGEHNFPERGDKGFGSTKN